MQEFLMKDSKGVFYELKESNMQTVLQELISELKRVEDYPMMPFVIRIATDLLEKEKEQIAIAYDRGYKACDLDEALEINKTMFSGERYYNQNYSK